LSEEIPTKASFFVKTITFASSEECLRRKGGVACRRPPQRGGAVGESVTVHGFLLLASFEDQSGGPQGEARSERSELCGLARGVKLDLCGTEEVRVVKVDGKSSLGLFRKN